MTVQKRGLGRGLEALLVDVTAKSDATVADDHGLITAVALIKAIQKENTNLIKEAEALQALLDDFETLVRNLNVDQTKL